MSSFTVRELYHGLPLWFREPVFELRRRCHRSGRTVEVRPIPIRGCLLGGDNGVAGSQYARVIGDRRRASRAIEEWPHVRFLRQYLEMGPAVFEPEVFERTDYYRNGSICIEFLGRYFDAVRPEELVDGARRFAECFEGAAGDEPPQFGQSPPGARIAVRRILYSDCYQVVDGHHRLAMAYLRGRTEVEVELRRPEVTTPLQDLLLDVLWLQRRQELYQPVEAPELRRWVLTRRCTDRLEKMLAFLRSENAMPPRAGSYLDLACSYGWFVAEMEKAGFASEGVERDPIAAQVGTLAYGLDPARVRRQDCASFLRNAGRRYDVVSCLSLLHHYLLYRWNVTAEEMLRLLDSVTGRVLFFEMGESHEAFFAGRLNGWNADRIEEWLRANTSFRRIVRLGVDEDAVAPFHESYGRTLFACVREGGQGAG